MEREHHRQWLTLLIKRSDRLGREEIKRFDRLSPAGTSLKLGNLCLIRRASDKANDGSLGVRNLSIASAGLCITVSLSVRGALIIS